MSPRFMHQARATGLLSLPSRRAEEDMLITCCARTAHHSTKKKGRTIPPRGRSFSHLILICPVEEKSLGVCSEDNRSHNSGVLAEKGQTKNHVSTQNTSCTSCFAIRVNELQHPEISLKVSLARCHWKNLVSPASCPFF